MRLSYESLLRGNVEVAELFGTPGNEARRNPEIRLLYDTALEWRELTGTWPMHHALAVHSDLLERDPELPARLIHAFRLSAQYGQEHLDELLDEFVREFGGDRDELEKRAQTSKIKDLYAWSLDDEDRRTVQTVLDMSAEFGYVKKRYTLEDIIAPC